MDLGQADRVEREARGQRGYALAALLVGLSVMAVLLSAAMPVWSHFAKREREEELIWRGQQYARAIGLFQRRFANTFPPNIDILVEQKFLRRKYKDPITNEDFQAIPAGGGAQIPGPQGGQPPQTGFGVRPPTEPGGTTGTGITSQRPSIGVQGVVSTSADTSIKIYNGRTKYNEWTFVAIAAANRIQPPGQGPQNPGTQRPGQGPFNPGQRPTTPGVRPPVQPTPPSSPFAPPPSRPPIR